MQPELHTHTHTADGHSDSHRLGHHHHDTSEIRSQPVVLDLGDRIGALIVYTGPELLGLEVELSPAGDDDARQHKQVLARMMGTEVVNVLVYDNLAEGEYTLWRGETPSRGVHVVGGSVAELSWR